jgi:hypothetical protein
LRTRIRRDKKKGYVTVEADTPAKAMRSLQAKLGPTPYVESAERVLRGGVAGFFAKERFQIRGRAEAPAAASVEDTEEGSSIAHGDDGLQLEERPDFASALSAALFGGVAADLEAEAESDAEPAGAGAAVLVADQPAPVAVGPLAGGPGPAAAAAAVGDADPFGGTTAGQGRSGRPAAEAAAQHQGPAWRLDGPPNPRPPGMGRVQWGASILLKAGIPKVIVEAAAGLDERDDLGWINALADSIAPHCRALPAGPTAFIGAGAEALAEDLEIPFVESGGEVPAGSFACDVPDDPEAIDWLSRSLGDRYLHLVVGEAPWLHLLVGDPAGVTFTSDATVVDALYVALTLGAPLGFGCTGDGSLVRVAPLEAALAVRRLVGRR